MILAGEAVELPRVACLAVGATQTRINGRRKEFEIVLQPGTAAANRIISTLVAGGEGVLESGTARVESLPEIFKGDGPVAVAPIVIGHWGKRNSLGTLADGLAVATVGKTVAKGKEIAKTADPGFGRHRAQQGCGTKSGQAESNGSAWPVWCWDLHRERANNFIKLTPFHNSSKRTNFFRLSWLFVTCLPNSQTRAGWGRLLLRIPVIASA